MKDLNKIWMIYLIDKQTTFIMAGIKDYTSLNYYSTVNSRLKSRKPNFFKKSKKLKHSYTGNKKFFWKSTEEDHVLTAMRLLVIVFAMAVVGIVFYLNYSFFVGLA